MDYQSVASICKFIFIEYWNDLKKKKKKDCLDRRKMFQNLNNAVSIFENALIYFLSKKVA